jgi:hypothetical protein
MAAVIVAAAGLVLAGCPNLTGDDNNNNGGNTDPKTLVISGLPADWNGRTVSAAPWDGVNDSSPVSGGQATISGGTATIALQNVGAGLVLSGQWMGSGDYYVAVWKTAWPYSGRPDYVTRTKVSFSSGTTSINYTNIIDFDEWYEQNADSNQDPNQGLGEQIGKISGTVTLTSIPAGASVSISASNNSSPYWSTTGSQLDLSGVSGASGTIPWTIPLHEKDVSSGAAWEGVTGTQTVNFSLYVSSSGSGNGDNFNVRVDGIQLDMTDKSNVQAGNITASLASLKLSGTISVNDGGSPVPQIYINAFAENQGYSLRQVSLESPASDAPWSMTIPAQQGEKVTFRVYGYDSASGGNTIFSKTFEPPSTASVSNQPISGIALNIGDISVGRLKGTVSFTNVPSPAPYRVYLYARYKVADNNWKSIGGGSSSTVTVSGAAGTWTIPQDDDFLAYLSSGSLAVTFELYMQLTESENSFRVIEVEKTLSAAGLTAVDLGTVSLAYITLSGTISVNDNGSPVPKVYISVQAQNKHLTQIGPLNSPAANSPWSVKIPAQGGEKATFFVYGYDAAGQNNVFNKTLEPSATASVSNQSISGIALNIGDVSSSGGGNGGDSGGGSTLAAAKGKLTLTGFNDFNGKYIFSALITTSGKALIGMNGATFSGAEAVISMVPISGGNAEVPLYYFDTAAAANGLGAYVPYDGNETFQVVSILIVNDSDGKFTSSDAASFATAYAGSISSNVLNNNFTPSTSNGSITISRNDAKTAEEIGGNYTSVNYILAVNQ